MIEKLRCKTFHESDFLDIVSSLRQTYSTSRCTSEEGLSRMRRIAKRIKYMLKLKTWIVFVLIDCHRSAYPAPFPITAHALTWFHSSLIEHTCNHLPSPFISSLTSVTHRLILRLQGCMVAALYTGRCLPVYPGSGPCLRKRKFTNS